MKPVTAAARFSTVGLDLVLSIVLLGYAGHWMELRWGFEPWGIVVGSLLGAIAGFRSLYKAAKLAEKEMDG